LLVLFKFSFFIYLCKFNHTILKGIDVCFPDRTEYESSVLFELAGLDPSTAAKYYQIEHLVNFIFFFFFSDLI